MRTALLALLTALPWQGAPPAEADHPAQAVDEVHFEARVVDAELAVGREALMQVLVEWPAGLDAGGAGLPAPILQLDVPACARLTEHHLSGYRELSRNEFLEAPFERLMEVATAKIPFELVAEPGEDDAIGLVLVAYVAEAEGDGVRFLRERIELPVAGGARSRDGDAADSSWGPDEGRLRIGDRAAAFDLPRADGTRLALAELLGDGPVLVTTYRAHW